MPSTRKKTLAIIDDDDAAARASSSATSATATTVTTGLRRPGHPRDAARRSPPRPSCSTSTSPTFDGFELLRLIGRRRRPARRRPCVALRSRGDFATFERAHRLGAAEFVTKPFSPTTCGAKVEALVSGRKQRSAGRLKLGALLVASGLVTQAQLDARPRAAARATAAASARCWCSEGLVTEQDIVTAVAGQMRIGVVDLAQTAPQANAIGLLPRDFIIRHRAHAAEPRRRRQPRAGHDQPPGRHHHRRGRHAHQAAHRAGHLHRERLRRGRRPSTSARAASSRTPATRTARSIGDGVDDIDADIIEIVDSLLTDAASMDASDIHLEPREDSLHVRCRIDGVLHDLREFPKELQAGIISRLKIMGNINIAERRLPQDGRTTFELSSGEAVDLRLASIPSLYGENITIRILEVSPLPPTLASLGLVGDNLARFEKALKAPRGRHRHRRAHRLGQVHHALHHARAHQVAASARCTPSRTPSSARSTGIVQTEVKPAIGLTFAQALRSLVRADPDVIMVGEIRDLETAKMAADAAVTGHQVFSTLHTNDASAAVNRLVEMGVPRYLVAAAWRCFVAQRLVRRLCPHCRQAETISDGRAGRSSAWARRRGERIKRLQAGRLHQVLRHRLPRPRRPLRGAGRRRRAARAHRHRRHRARHPAHGARAKGVTSLRDDGIARCSTGTHQLPRAAARHHLTPSPPRQGVAHPGDAHAARLDACSMRPRPPLPMYGQETGRL